MISKITRHSLEKEVIELRAKGFGYITISEKIKTIHGLRLSHMSVKRFLDSSAEVTSEVISEKEEQREKFANLRLDAIEKLMETSSIIDESLEKYDKDWRAHSTFLELKIRNTDIMLKLTKNIQPKEKPKIDATAYQNMFHNIMDKVFDKAELKEGKLIVSNPEIINHYKEKNKIWD